LTLDLLGREAAMNDYLLLYSGGHKPESEEEQAMVMKAWMNWMGELGDALKDEMAKGCPVLQGGAQISVFETFAVM
jgi:hypothetical protein